MRRYASESCSARQDYPTMEVGQDARSGVGPRNQRTPLPAGLDGHGEE